MDRTASGQKLCDRSRERNGRLPIMWQIELMDHVTWLEIARRTSPPQKKPVSTPAQDHEMSPPSTAGSNRLTATQMPNVLLTRTLARSASRSGMNRRWLVSLRSKNQVMWACRKPRATASGDVPNSHGECGSPSRSEKA